MDRILIDKYKKALIDSKLDNSLKDKLTTMLEAVTNENIDEVLIRIEKALNIYIKEKEYGILKMEETKLKIVELENANIVSSANQQSQEEIRQIEDIRSKLQTLKQKSQS